MKYTAILDEKERELEVIRHDEYHFRVYVDGQLHEVDARKCGPDLLSILIDDVSHDISYSLDDVDVLLNFRNRYYNIEVLDERRMRMRRVRSEFEMSGPEIIKTSMPGKVVKVLVEEGQQVEPGKGVIIIEAMKMENEIMAPVAGTVKSITVSKGASVNSGDVLVVIG